MARPAKFSTDSILDAAAEAVRERWRGATVADVAKLLKTPPGSIYYRFESRDHLFTSLWLRALERFHQGLLIALTAEDPRQAALEAAAHIPRFCRDQRREAIVLTLYRQPELVTSAPASLREEVAHVNDEVIAAMVRLAERLYGRAGNREVALVAMACQECPYGLVRSYLRADEPVPSWLDEAVLASSAAILDLGAPRTSPPLGG